MAGQGDTQSVRSELHPESPIEPELSRRRLTALDVTDGIRELAMDGSSTPLAASQATQITQFVYEQGRSQRLSRGTIRTSQPKLMRRAVTAPAGTSYLLPVVPKPLRRVISAGTASSSHSRSSRNQQSELWSASQLGRTLDRDPTPRSLISRRINNRKPIGRLGLKPKPSVKRVQQPLKRYQLMSEALGGQGKSFSGKARVMETLKNKRVDSLKTNMTELDGMDLPDTPGSIGNTPIELYSKSGDADPDHAKGQVVPTHTAKHSPFHSSPDIQHCKWIARTGTVLAHRIPKIEHYERAVYTAGPIRLVAKVTAAARRDSMATLEQVEVQSGAGECSDVIALDGIVAHFEELGVAEETSEDGLDKFWVHEVETNRPIPSPRRPTAVPPIPARPRPLSEALSGSLMPPPIRAAHQQDEQPRLRPPHVRQRIRLRRLLNSAATHIL